MTAWTEENSAVARAQGWDVFEIEAGRVTLEIRRDNASNIFLTDEAAREYVKAKASAGAVDSIWAKAQIMATQSRN